MSIVGEEEAEADGRVLPQRAGISLPGLLEAVLCPFISALMPCSAEPSRGTGGRARDGGAARRCLSRSSHAFRSPRSPSPSIGWCCIVLGAIGGTVGTWPGEVDDGFEAAIDHLRHSHMERGETP